MADDSSGRARELVLAPNEFAYILDLTKGDINLYVGPKKDSLAQSDQPVIFNYKTKRFEYVPIEKAVQTMVIAPEGFYVVLKNPVKDNKHPPIGSRSSMPELETGRKINIPGPCAFATWPAQMAKVLQGHRIRSNQYLLVRVYDEKAAQANWKNTIIKTTDGDSSQSLSETAESLTMGKLIVIRGTDVSFFIPQTGIEVVADQDGKLVRDAVTLERLDYCLLLDENGNKRFERGPAVVFPKPTEIFRTRMTLDGESTRKFRAIELSDTSGIYLKVIADYKDDSGANIEAGEELFVTGKEEKIYFPREEHAIIKYGEHEVHYATAIPAGEGRYVLNRLTGDVRLVKGPTMFLADPRAEVICKRVLDGKLCALIYPGNAEALQHNIAIQGFSRESFGAVAGSPSKTQSGVEKTSAIYGATMYASSAAMVSNAAMDRGLGDESAKGFTGDGFDRLGRYTEPRSITLHTKYSGAVSSDLWTGFAVKLVRKSGDMRVEVGPKTVMLEYDEAPQILNLSTGKPKNMDALRSTVFLQIKANKVSDIIDVESRDFCKMKLKLSYRVNFEGDPKKWFDVENYVKFLTDNMRSRLRAAVMQYGIEDFYQGAVGYIRNIVLGEKKEGVHREGTSFEENGMRVYDVEVLEVEILDKNVEKLLVTAQRIAIEQRLELVSQKRKLDFTKENEDVLRQIAKTQAETQFATLALQQETVKHQLESDLVKIGAMAKQEAEAHAARTAKENGINEIAKIALLRTKEAEEQDIEIEGQRSARRLMELTAEVQAVVEKARAVTPDLVAALQAYGDKAMIEKLSEAMSPLAILGGTSVTDVVKKLLEGTKLAQYVAMPSSNGQAPKLPTSASA